MSETPETPQGPADELVESAAQRAARDNRHRTGDRVFRAKPHGWPWVL